LMTKSLSSWTTAKEKPGQMPPNLDAGLLWVQNRIRELSEDPGRPVDCLEWPQPQPPAGLIPLKIWRGGAYGLVEFQREELLKVEGDPEVQRRVGERMRETMRTAVLDPQREA